MLTLFCRIGWPLFIAMAYARLFDFIHDDRYIAFRPGEVFVMMGLCGVALTLSAVVALITTIATANPIVLVVALFGGIVLSVLFVPLIGRAILWYWLHKS